MNYILAAVGTSLLGAAVITVTKLLAHDIPPYTFTVLRYGLASLFFIPFLFWRDEWQKVRPQDIPIFFILGLAQVTFYNVFFVKALERTSATTIGIISALSPIITIMAASIWLQERPSRSELLSFLLSLMGAVIIVTKGNIFALGEITNTGSLYMLAAVLCQVVFTFALAKISTIYSALYLTFLALTTGVLCTIPFVESSFFEIISHISPQAWLGILFISALGTSLAFYLNTVAIKYLGASLSTLITFATMPVFVFILSFLLLGETITSAHILGGLLVISSLILGLKT
jgi:drug/metabolite transporter (DMT)-like permease